MLQQPAGHLSSAPHLSKPDAAVLELKLRHGTVKVSYLKIKRLILNFTSAVLGT